MSANEDALRKGYAAFQSGDIPTALGLMAEDVVWHVPGNNQLSGEYVGRDGVMTFLGQSMELTGGTFRLEVHDILVNDEHGVVLAHVTADRDGKHLDDNSVQVFHLRDGVVVEQWLQPGSQAEADAFWA